MLIVVVGSKVSYAIMNYLQKNLKGPYWFLIYNSLSHFKFCQKQSNFTSKTNLGQLKSYEMLDKDDL